MPLRFVVCGFLLIVFNITIGDFDFLPDPVGWLLVVVGLRRLASHFGGSFTPALYCAGAAGVVSLASVLTSSSDSITVLPVVDTVLSTAVAWFIFSGIISRAEDSRFAEERTVQRARTLRAGVLVLGVCSVFINLAGASLVSTDVSPTGPTWLVPLVAVWAVAVVVWFVVTLVFWWAKSAESYLRVR